MKSGLTSIERATALIARLRMVHPRMELQTAAMFLIVAHRKEVTKPQLQTLMGMATGPAWRNLELLEELKLINVTRDGQGNTARLTPHGERFAQSLGELFDTQEGGQANGR